MTAEPGNISSSQAKFRKTISEEGIEAKRLSGEISCAECKRSKLKCDKVRIFRLMTFHTY